jgi:hypothetical protein
MHMPHLTKHGFSNSLAHFPRFLISLGVVISCGSTFYWLVFLATAATAGRLCAMVACLLPAFFGASSAQSIQLLLHLFKLQEKVKKFRVAELDRNLLCSCGGECWWRGKRGSSSGSSSSSGRGSMR